MTLDTDIFFVSVEVDVIITIRSASLLQFLQAWLLLLWLLLVAAIDVAAADVAVSLAKALISGSYEEDRHDPEARTTADQVYITLTSVCINR